MMSELTPDEFFRRFEQLPDPPSRFTASLLAASTPKARSPLIAPLRAIGSPRRALQQLKHLEYLPDSTFATDVAALKQRYRLLLSEIQCLKLAIRPLERLLRLSGVWDEYNARRYAAYNILLNPLRELTAWDTTLRAALEAGRLPDNPDFAASLDAYLDRQGQRGWYELDLACPRLRDTPEILIPLLLQAPTAPQPSRSLLGGLTLPLRELARGYLHSEDRLRHASMESIALIREHLLALAEDVFPDPEALWRLDIDEVQRLDAGWRPDAALLDQRRANAEMSIPGWRRPPP